MIESARPTLSQRLAGWKLLMVKTYAVLLNGELAEAVGSKREFSSRREKPLPFQRTQNNRFLNLRIF